MAGLSCEVVKCWGGPGVEPHRLPLYILTNHIGTRGANELGHVSTPYQPLMTRVNTVFANARPTKICHVIELPRHHDGTALPHVSVRTVRTGTVNIPNFCLFGLVDRSRYLLHTDSVCKSKYTTGIRKTRRMQWHCFRHIPSTLKIEQNLIP
jgi:hypothetical protein